MHMADFRVCEAELTPSEAMWVNRNPGPRRNNIFEFLQWLHKSDSSKFWIPQQARSIQAFVGAGIEAVR